MQKMKQFGSKKTRLTPRELLHDHEAGGSGSAAGWNLRELAPKRRNEEQEDLGGDTGTSSFDDVDDENYVDPSAFLVRHHGKGPATNQGDDEDPMDEDVQAEGCQTYVHVSTQGSELSWYKNDKETAEVEGCKFLCQ
jgi:hypothetical protein